MDSCHVNYFSFLSSDATTSLHAVSWVPDSEVTGLFQICHGMSEHMGRYDHFARFLAKNGYLVCGFDCLGHGRSAKTPEDFGFFAEQDGWPLLIQDAYLFSKYIRGKHGFQLPCFLMGHSMGSFIARHVAMRHSGELTALILSGTSCGDRNLADGIALAEKEKTLFGSRYRSHDINRQVFAPFFERLPDAKTNRDWLTRDEDMLAAHMTDPYARFVFTTAGFIDLFHMMDACTRDGWANSIRKDLPVYLFSGEEDPVGAYGEGVRKVQNDLLYASVTRVACKIYSGGRHEMLNELNRKEVYNDLLAYLQSIP